MVDLVASATASGLRIAIVVSCFNKEATEKLLEGARAAFLHHGGDVAQLDVVYTPGAFELPQAAAKLAALGKWDALVALGVVIRGETSHFEYISSSAIKGLSQVAHTHKIPVGLGVLTVDSLSQALERAGGAAGNKGADAMTSALKMAQLFTLLHQQAANPNRRAL